MIGSGNRRSILWATTGVVLVIAVITFEVRWTAPIRQSMRTFSELIAAGNRNDLRAASLLCSARYRKARPLRLAPEGGISGLPRRIDKNFQTWRNGSDVWVGPSNRGDRARPIYRLIFEENSWRFDGLVGSQQDGSAIDPSGN